MQFKHQRVSKLDNLRAQKRNIRTSPRDNVGETGIGTDVEASSAFLKTSTCSSHTDVEAYIAFLKTSTW